MRLRCQKLLTTFKANQGVTFIELVMVISIFSIIAGTLLLNFSRFNRNITIQNLTQDIALHINAAQKEAISGRTNDLLASCDRTQFDCTPRYGLYFVARGVNDSIMTGFGGIAGQSMLKFFDFVGPFDAMLNSGYSTCGPNAATECLDNISLGQGNYISEICVGSGLACDNVIQDGISISFKRPFPNATIKDDSGVSYNYARITVTSPNVDTRSKDIVVTNLGQISIEAHPITP